MAVVIEGILKRGTGNRGYLVYRNELGQNQIVRVRPVPDARSGETLTVVGEISGRQLSVQSFRVRVFPRATARAS